MPSDARLSVGAMQMSNNGGAAPDWSAGVGQLSINAAGDVILYVGSDGGSRTYFFTTMYGI
jgi:hypothetical protein